MHSNKIKKLVDHLKRNTGFKGIPKSNSGPSQIITNLYRDDQRKLKDLEEQQRKN